jgi:hypothetical protein
MLSIKTNTVNKMSLGKFRKVCRNSEFQMISNRFNNWPKSALMLVNNELSDGPDKATIALGDEPALAFKGRSSRHLSRPDFNGRELNAN